MLSTILFFLSLVTLGFVISWRNYKKDYVKNKEPFDLTELSKNSPTPTPTIEKKKRGRKPKNT